MADLVHLVVTATGEYRPTPALRAAFVAAKLRKDRQPDLRTKEGKLWRTLFNDFSREKLNEYLARG